MKKNIIIAIALIICMTFAGCTAYTGSAGMQDTNTVEESISENTETGGSSEEINNDIPDATYFDIFEWPSFGASTKIPSVDWSDRGKILADSENTFWAQVGYSTKENYEEYVKDCQEMGYTENYYNVAGYMYYGKNADGYAVQLTYNQYEHYIAIQVTSNVSEWNKWWIDEES